MKEINLEDLDRSIDTFKETITSLTEIKRIADSISRTVEEIGDENTAYKATAEKCQEAAERIASEAAQLEKRLAEQKEAYREALDAAASRAETIAGGVNQKIEALSEDVTSCTATVNERYEATDKQIQNYTNSALKSIDELRIQGTNNSREIRDKIVETDTRTRTEMDSRFKTVEQLTTELAALRAQQKRSQIIGLIGGISAALAAISSFLHFFF